MLAVVHLAAVTAAATLVAVLAFHVGWRRALLVAVAGTLAGVTVGAVLGVIVDVITGGGDILQPAGAVGDVLSAMLGLGMIAARWRRHRTGQPEGRGRG